MRMTKAEIHEVYLKDCALVKKYADDKKKLLEEMVVLHYNLPEIVITAKSKQFKNTEVYQDLYQAGLEGMCKAMKTFDTSRGTPFFFHAKFWVFKHVTDELTKMNLILDKSGGVRAYSVDNLEEHCESMDLDEYFSEIVDEDRNIEISNDRIAEFIKDNATEIKIVAMNIVDGIPMSVISKNEGIGMAKVRGAIKGKYNKDGILVRESFIDIFTKFIVEETNCESFADFKEKYIKYV